MLQTGPFLTFENAALGPLISAVLTPSPRACTILVLSSPIVPLLDLSVVSLLRVGVDPAWCLERALQSIGLRTLLFLWRLRTSEGTLQRRLRQNRSGLSLWWLLSMGLRRPDIVGSLPLRERSAPPHAKAYPGPNFQLAALTKLDKCSPLYKGPRLLINYNFSIIKLFTLKISDND